MSRRSNPLLEAIYWNSDEFFASADRIAHKAVGQYVLEANFTTSQPGHLQSSVEEMTKRREHYRKALNEVNADLGKFWYLLKKYGLPVLIACLTMAISFAIWSGFAMAPVSFPFLAGGAVVAGGASFEITRFIMNKRQLVEEVLDLVKKVMPAYNRNKFKYQEEVDSAASERDVRRLVNIDILFNQTIDDLITIYAHAASRRVHGLDEIDVRSIFRFYYSSQRD